MTATSTSNAQVHPAFRAALASFSVPADLMQIKRVAYIKALKAHVWAHEFSDDGDVAQRGREQLRELRLVQEEVDPSFAIWNAHCHPACVGGRVYA